MIKDVKEIGKKVKIIYELDVDEFLKKIKNKIEKWKGKIDAK